MHIFQDLDHPQVSQKHLGHHKNELNKHLKEMLKDNQEKEYWQKQFRTLKYRI